MTNGVDSDWLQNAYINSKIKYMRINLNLNTYYSNTSAVSGVNMTGDLTNWTDLISFAKTNDNRVLLTIESIPTWLADNSSGKCTELSRCPALNYTKLANIILDEYYRIGCTSSVCDIELMNEPYSGFMGGLSYDNVSRALNYTVEYLGIQSIIKANDSAIQLGGPSGFRSAPIMTSTFLTNVSVDKRDFISIHPYGCNKVNGLEQYNDVNDLYTLCTTLGVSCGDRIVLSEWGIGNSALQNLTYGADEYSKSYAQTYVSLLNSGFINNLSLTPMIWKREGKYNSSYPEYPFLWEFVSGPTDDNTYRPPYNVTKSFASYCPSGATVGSSISNNSYEKTVLTRKGQMVTLALINTDTEAHNFTINSSLFGISSLTDIETGTVYTPVNGIINFGLVDSYDVLWLSSGELNASLGIGISAVEFRPRYLTEQDIWATNQTNTKGVFNVSNIGGGPANTIGIKLNQTQSGWGIECNNRTAGSWINLTTSFQTIYSNLTVGDSFQTWCRADLNNPTSQFKGKIIFNITG
jgi:hypothetical protein